MKVIDQTKICRKYPGSWVALKSDEETVIASGETVKEVMKEAQKKRYPKPILFRVPTKIIPYVGGFSV